MCKHIIYNPNRWLVTYLSRCLKIVSASPFRGLVALVNVAGVAAKALVKLLVELLGTGQAGQFRMFRNRFG